MRVCTQRVVWRTGGRRGRVVWGVLARAFVSNRGQAEPIKTIGKFFYPTSPDAPYASVTTDNAGEAAAVIVTNPAKHAGKVYNVVGPAYTNAELAAAFTAELGKPIEYVQLPYEAVSASFLEKGWPAWQVRKARCRSHPSHPPRARLAARACCLCIG